MTHRKRIPGQLALGALLSIGLATACSKPATVEPVRIAEASPADQQRIQAAERELDRARDGLGRAQAATDQAKEFQRTAAEEQQSAESAYAEAARSVERSQGTRDANLATSIERRHQATELASQEFDAKVRFADDLLTLREKEQALAEADVKLQETLVERAKFDAAERASDVEGLERADFVRAEDSARIEFGEAQRAVDEAKQRSDASQKEWLLARNRSIESGRR